MIDSLYDDLYKRKIMTNAINHKYHKFTSDSRTMFVFVYKMKNHLRFHNWEERAKYIILFS